MHSKPGQLLTVITSRNKALKGNMQWPGRQCASQCSLGLRNSSNTALEAYSDSVLVNLMALVMVDCRFNRPGWSVPVAWTAGLCDPTV